MIHSHHTRKEVANSPILPFTHAVPVIYMHIHLSFIIYRLSINNMSNHLTIKNKPICSVYVLILTVLHKRLYILNS